MRYYRLQITNPQTGAPVNPESLGYSEITSLLPNGNPNPAALDLQFDIPVSMYHTPTGQPWLQIPGLGIKYTGNQNDLNGLNIVIYGGMSKGLPLANPAQRGVLAAGEIYQAFGNWQGKHMTVDMLLRAAPGTMRQPANWILNWPAGTRLADALTSAFRIAMPSAAIEVNVSPDLVLNHDEMGYYATLTQFASVIFRLSKSIITSPGYPGVIITCNGLQITATDGTAARVPTIIAYQDLIGMPTWIGPNMISFKTVMRGDLDIMDLVTLPRTPAVITNQAVPAFSPALQQQQTTFSGNFVISDIHHYGNFRQPDADSWCSVFQAFQPGHPPQTDGAS